MDPNGPGVVHEDGAPETPWVPRAVDALAELERARDVAPPVLALLGGAGHLDGQHVLRRRGG
ncbi:MAG: hypothetical protein WKF58_08650 [Ilumatobacteraceae bacterium]